MGLTEDERVFGERRRGWLVLSLVAGLGPITARRAVEQAFGVTGALKLSHAGWAEVEGIGSYRAKEIIGDLPRAAREADMVAAKCEAAGIGVVTLEDESYPALMRDLPDAPPVLYVRGRLEPRDLNSVAVVGSRKCSLYGREQATRLSALLAGAGLTVVSGGARGVDSAAHEGAMRGGGGGAGRTIAVLGCGVDVAYPPENAALFDRIVSGGGVGGAVVSHYPPGTPPNSRHFPERNRVISGMSRGVLVVEADERSGSLITARYAADDHNRPVLALPGRVDNALSAGPHKLLKEGAALVTNLEDILEALGPLPESAYRARTHVRPTTGEDPSSKPTCDQPPPAHRTSGPQGELSFTRKAPKPPEPASIPSSADFAGLTEVQRKLLEALSERDETSAEALIEATGLPAGTVMGELTMLTLKGKVKRVDAQTFVLRR